MKKPAAQNQSEQENRMPASASVASEKARPGLVGAGLSTAMQRKLEHAIGQSRRMAAQSAFGERVHQGSHMLAEQGRQAAALQRKIRVDAMNDGEEFEDVGVDLVPSAYGFTAAGKTVFLTWLRDGQDHHMATRAEFIVKVTEEAEHGHSLARHGPALSDDVLKRRLYTGIAPDDALSPAPGASSRFLTYAAVLETRQAASATLAQAIVATQKMVLDWKRVVLQGGALDTAVAAKTADLATKQGDVDRLGQDVEHFGQTNQLETKKNEITELKISRETKQGELDEVEDGLQGKFDFETGLRTDPAEGAEKTALEAKKARLEGEIAAINVDLARLQPIYDALFAEQNRRRGLHRAATDNVLRPAEAAKAAAEDERAHPGKNLAKYLKAAGGIQFAVGDDASAGTLGQHVKLVDQYSIVVDHKKPIGTGMEGLEMVSLTDVVAQVAVDPLLDDPQPKPLGQIIAALQALSLVEEQATLAAFLNNPANLKLAKAKGEKAAKLYKRTQGAGDLVKSFTNYATGSKVLFDDSDKPVLPATAGWSAIQHFPARNDAEDGVQEKA